ncbi:microfibril associated protein 5 isoform X2 [Mugil cephalus]|uniref:microfibril associated protein 5 isoform X2 n=1 Tax=Mugil cephalus TaxID=48193 RepID=UPI001FB7CD5F|nr:microfibril associated protein 5 isoform X2 [Mugil cephalus]
MTSALFHNDDSCTKRSIRRCACVFFGRGKAFRKTLRRQGMLGAFIWKGIKGNINARKPYLLQVEGMGSLPVVLLLCSFHALTAVAQTQQTEENGSNLPADCREEMYPCTRMYSVHRPIKTCVGGLCFYSLPRVYVINNEICVRTVCQQDEYLKAELCRELSGWPRRVQRSSNKKPCRSRRSNPKTWANKA